MEQVNQLFVVTCHASSLARHLVCLSEWNTQVLVNATRQKRYWIVRKPTALTKTTQILLQYCKMHKNVIWDEDQEDTSVLWRISINKIEKKVLATGDNTRWRTKDLGSLVSFRIPLRVCSTSSAAEMSPSSSGSFNRFTLRRAPSRLGISDILVAFLSSFLAMSFSD